MVTPDLLLLRHRVISSGIVLELKANVLRHVSLRRLNPTIVLLFFFGLRKDSWNIVTWFGTGRYLSCIWDGDSLRDLWPQHHRICQLLLLHSLKAWILLRCFFFLLAAEVIMVPNPWHVILWNVWLLLKSRQWFLEESWWIYFFAFLCLVRLYLLSWLLFVNFYWSFIVFWNCL